LRPFLTKAAIPLPKGAAKAWHPPPGVHLLSPSLVKPESGEFSPHSLARRQAMALGWHDIQEIAERLFEKYDTLDPLTVRFTDMHKWILDLEDFEGKAEESNEKILEAIQMAWYEEWQDEYGD
jgi:FeS assembly protein IscX